MRDLKQPTFNKGELHQKSMFCALSQNYQNLKKKKKKKKR